jgi:hypothetical protein
MTHRDASGHFISDAEWEELGRPQFSDGGEAEVGNTLDVEDTGEGEEEATPEAEEPSFGRAERVNQGSIFVDIGRGGSSEVAIGSPFVATLERLASEAHYGGYFRIFLNGNEVINPEDSPATIDKGMRIAITSYDKVG